MQRPTWGGADREWRKLRGLGEYANMTKRTAKILGLLDKQNNIRECAEGEKSQYSQERWAFLLDADFKISDRCCYHMKKSPIKKFGKQRVNPRTIQSFGCENSTVRPRSWK